MMAQVGISHIANIGSVSPALTRSLSAGRQSRAINRACMIQARYFENEDRATMVASRRQITSSALILPIVTAVVAHFVGVQPVYAAGRNTESFTGGEGRSLEDKYQNPSSKKTSDAAKRKAELSRKRAQRIAAGGATDGQNDGAAAKQKFEAAGVEQATKEAEDSNALRAAEGEKMLAAIRSKAGTYDSSASKVKLKTNY